MWLAGMGDAGKRGALGEGQALKPRRLGEGAPWRESMEWRDGLGAQQVLRAHLAGVSEAFVVTVDSLDHPVFERESLGGMSRCQPAILEPCPGVSEVVLPLRLEQPPQPQCASSFLSSLAFAAPSPLHASDQFPCSLLKASCLPAPGLSAHWISQPAVSPLPHLAHSHSSQDIAPIQVPGEGFPNPCT